MIFRKLKLIRKLRAENYQLRKKNVRHENKFVNKCHYDNLLDENDYLNNCRITDFENILKLKKELKENNDLIMEQHITILTLTKL
tara:strand:+ start:31 stop:285 length:255 start_codon:yes stop_codon:yes gene_type:complete